MESEDFDEILKIILIYLLMYLLIYLVFPRLQKDSFSIFRPCRRFCLSNCISRSTFLPPLLYSFIKYRDDFRNHFPFIYKVSRNKFNLEIYDILILKGRGSVWNMKLWIYVFTYTLRHQLIAFFISRTKLFFRMSCSLTRNRVKLQLYVNGNEKKLTTGNRKSNQLMT